MIEAQAVQVKRPGFIGELNPIAIFFVVYLLGTFEISNRNRWIAVRKSQLLSEVDNHLSVHVLDRYAK
ncbi:hypothetical protein M405DRAFT_828939 [Rhizopogon salebrosus TDB-379]|nr:hypothetical protein M405DRAFT_828939 [Rhizopogon salebrosus TDB-379]